MMSSSLKGLFAAASAGQIPRPSSLCSFQAPSMAACGPAQVPLSAADHSLVRVAVRSGAAAAQRPVECCHAGSHVAARAGAGSSVATGCGRDPVLRGLRLQSTLSSATLAHHHHHHSGVPLLRVPPSSTLPLSSSCSRGVPPLRCSLSSHASLASQAHPACPPSPGGVSAASSGVSAASAGLGGSLQPTAKSAASAGLGATLQPPAPGFASLAGAASPAAASPSASASASAAAARVVFRHAEVATDELAVDVDDDVAAQEARRAQLQYQGEGNNGASSSSSSSPGKRSDQSYSTAASAALGQGGKREGKRESARGRFRNSLEPNPMTQEAWELLQASTVYYCNQPVGTVAASDPTDSSPLNYDQVFIRDFIPSALAFMLSGQSEIVRNFLLYTLQLQSWEKTVDCHRPGEGLMPASFKVTQVPVEGGQFGEYEEHLDPDFGESAIGRVAPVDSGLWWIQLLRAYGRCTGDYSLQQRLDVQTGIKLILKICLADHFDMFPTLITTDGSCMIDRRLGIHGHPLEIQSLLYGALRAAKEMILPENGGAELIRTVDARLTALSFHIRQYYWLDQRKLNEIYRYKTEEYSYEAVNKFNIYPDQIPSWLMDWIPDRGGYFVGNVQPAHMDFRFFNLGNMWAIVSALASPTQAEGILDLVEERWDELVGAMPLKIVYPALEKEEWRIITGADPKNTPWSYHNGGSWPVLLWQFTAACIKMGRPHLAQRAVELVEKRLQLDRWPEYYDTKSGRFIGKQARLHQTWSIAGYLASKLLLANPEAVWLFAIEEDQGIAEATSSFMCNTGAPKRRRLKATVPLSMMR